MTQTAERTVPYEVYEREHALRIQAERERDCWKQEFYLQREIRRAPVLRPIGKAVLEECRHVEKWGTVKAPDGSTRANFTTIAKHLHTSPDTITREAERLEKLGLIEIHEHQGPKDERDRKYIHVKEEKLSALRQLEDPEQVIPKQGGNRYICPTCDSPNVVIRKVRTLHCLACNHEEIIEDTGWIMQNGQKLQKQVAFEQSKAEQQPAEKQLAEHSIPSTPPAVEPILDPQETERQAAQLLVAIAGDAPAHIEMSRTSESTKYFTVHSPLTDQELLAHLRGATTKGVFNRSLDGMTRAIFFDGDTPADWQGLIDAAQQLAAADDFKPILEPSPSPGEHAGGGHMGVIYDAPVDAYSALQTLYQYVPGLRQYKEHWPGGGINMRLPGGKYVRPGFEAECHLFDENMQNGIGTAAMLLERQTPASVVREYTRPAPEPPREQPARQGQGGYLEQDLAKQYIAEYNASVSWGDLAAMCGGYDRRGFFPAIWRENSPPYDVHVDPRTDKAKDFGAKAWIAAPMDKYQVYCLIQGGQNWEAFRKQDLAERCAYRRAQQERRAS